MRGSATTWGLHTRPPKDRPAPGARGTARATPTGPQTNNQATTGSQPPSVPASASPPPVDRLRRLRHPGAELVRERCVGRGQGDEGRRGVQQHGVPYGPRLTVEQATGDVRVVGRVGAAQGLPGTSSRPTSRGSNRSSVTLPSRSRPGTSRWWSARPGRRRRGRRARSCRARRTRHDRCHAQVRDSDGLCPHPRRVRQRTQHVERGPDPQLPRAAAT